MSVPDFVSQLLPIHLLGELDTSWNRSVPLSNVMFDSIRLSLDSRLSRIPKIVLSCTRLPETVELRTGPNNSNTLLTIVDVIILGSYVAHTHTLRTKAKFQ